MACSVRDMDGKMLQTIRAIELDIVQSDYRSSFGEKKGSVLTKRATLSTKCCNKCASSGSLRGHGRWLDRSGVPTTCVVGETTLLLVCTW